jgi:hypothetical protein
MSLHGWAAPPKIFWWVLDFEQKKFGCPVGALEILYPLLADFVRVGWAGLGPLVSLWVSVGGPWDDKK